MADSSQRNGWQSILARWQDASLVDDETAARIREWEAVNVTQPRPARLVDALSYLGGTIMLVGALMALALVEDDGGGWLALPFLLGLLAGGTAWLTSRFGLQAFADCLSGGAIILVAVGLALVLDEIGNDGQESLGYLLICLCVIVVGSLFVRAIGTPISAILTSAAVAVLPFAIAVEGNSLQVDVFDGARQIETWSLWAAFASVVLLGGGTLWLLHRATRWQASGLVSWARLGASLGSALALLGLAAASSTPAMDWMLMLVGVAITAVAVRQQHVELLPASAALILGSIVGGLSDFHSELRVTLSLVVLALLLQSTLMSRAWSRQLGPLADHWLTPLWRGALLGGGVLVASFFAAEGGWLAAIGIIWGLALLISGVTTRSGLSVVFGGLGVYLPGLMLIVDEDVGVVGVIGTVLLGLVIVIGGIIWQRRDRSDRIDTAQG